MGVRLYNNDFSVFPIKDENRKKQEHLELKQEQKDVQKENNIFKEIDIPSNEILANYNKASLRNTRHKIKDGHSRYEYKGARFDVYKRGDEYKSQFVHPKGFDTQEFIDVFPELESQPIVKTDSTGDSIKSINGEIDEIASQSSVTGDCWLIASVTSMSKTEKGKEIIKNSITVNDDNTVTVSFKGIGVSYTLTEEEIAKYDTDSETYDSYSNGDNDMLVLELATEKLWKDIELGRVKLDTKDENITFSGNGYGIDNGGLPSQMVYYLTGIESDEYYYDDLSAIGKNDIYKILENALDSSNTIINFGIYDDVHSCTLTDGSTFSLDVGSGGHALAVTKVTQDTVTFINPWDTTIEYTATWEEFASLGIGYVAVSDLSKASEKEIVDMTQDDYSYGYNYNPYSDYNYNHYNYDYGYSSFDYKKPDFDYSYNKPDFNKDIPSDDSYNKSGFDKDMPDFEDDEKQMPDFKPSYDDQSSILDIVYKLMDLLYSMLSFIRI